jgi:hypothetical protein
MIRPGIRMGRQAMVHVHGGQGEAKALPQGGQGMKQHDGIQAAGVAHRQFAAGGKISGKEGGDRAAGIRLALP